MSTRPGSLVLVAPTQESARRQRPCLPTYSRPLPLSHTYVSLRLALWSSHPLSLSSPRFLPALGKGLRGTTVNLHNNPPHLLSLSLPLPRTPTPGPAMDGSETPKNKRVKKEDTPGGSGGSATPKTPKSKQFGLPLHILHLSHRLYHTRCVVLHAPDALGTDHVRSLTPNASSASLACPLPLLYCVHRATFPQLTRFACASLTLVRRRASSCLVVPRRASTHAPPRSVVPLCSA